VSRTQRCLVFVSDQLEAPPRLGYHVHLLALARAAAAHVAVRAFVWAAPGAALPEHLVALDPGAAPAGKLARKRHYLRRVREWLDAHAAPGSVVWVRGYSAALLLAPYLRRARERGLVSVYDAASFVRLEIGQQGHPLLDAARAFVEERLWPHFDRIRTLSDPMRDYLVARGVPPAKVVVLPVGADLPAETWRPRDRPSRLLYVGSDAGWQGLPQLIEAMRRLDHSAPAVSLSAVGVEAGAAAAAGAPGNIRFLGRVPHAEIARHYLEHDLFVVPRPRTPLTDLVVPMKIPEAMAFGLPILASDLGAIRWTAGEGGAFLVPDNSPAALERGIRDALADPERLAAVGARARERAGRFAWECIGAELAAALFPAAG
jgi:glycosyltransferase involved in cell wall biosynthesis